MPKYEVGVYLTSFNAIDVEADTAQEAKEFALKLWGTDQLELYTDKHAEAVIEIEYDKEETNASSIR